MSDLVYGRQALRELRQQQTSGRLPERAANVLEQIPADVPMDDATITGWTGERFMAYDQWLAKRPVAIEDEPQQKTVETADCGAPKQAPPQGSEQEKLW